MAPEQLEGDEADARTDIFALGAVLYEMATGRRAFDGKTKTSLIAAIVGSEPKPIRELQPLTPRRVRARGREVPREGSRGALAERLDVASELEWISGATSIEQVAGEKIRRKGRRRAAMIAAVALAAIAAAVAASMLLMRPRAPSRRSSCR